MALVSYSDSEASDSETEKKIETSPKKEAKEPTAAPPTNPNPPKPSTTTTTKAAAGGFQPLVDRSNPRKIRVALPEIKPENEADGEGDGEPARKRAKIGGGGAFAGFNSLLPAPKRTAAQNAAAGDKKTSAPARKVFSLKTGATPGFDREADAEMRRDQAFTGGAGADDESIPAAGSLREGDEAGPAEPEPEKKEEPKLKGNAMMFKPLSVARNPQRRKPATAFAARAGMDGLEKTAQLKKAADAEAQPAAASAPSPTPAPAPQKPKVSLFSISSEERATPSDTTAQPTQDAYQPLVYNKEPDGPPTGPDPEPSAPESYQSLPESIPQDQDQQTATQTLDNIANDLNLSHSERRQLLGRQSAASKSKILTFDTNKEYVANQQLSQTELAAAQHNPVRAIAPGKHTLRQLVNAASSQREALEESFAAGRRNKKEAGSRYGW
ncbi:hypothetical protein VTN02DRAFT_4006 [Thermoascus thermophilus]